MENWLRSAQAAPADGDGPTTEVASMGLMDDSRRDRARSSTFQTTRWSLVLAARGEVTEAREALAELCEAYWDPLYAFVRRKGYDADNALDRWCPVLIGDWT